MCIGGSRALWDVREILTMTNTNQCKASCFGSDPVQSRAGTTFPSHRGFPPTSATSTASTHQSWSQDQCFCCPCPSGSFIPSPASWRQACAAGLPPRLIPRQDVSGPRRAATPKKCAYTHIIMVLYNMHARRSLAIRRPARSETRYGHRPRDSSDCSCAVNSDVSILLANRSR